MTSVAKRLLPAVVLAAAVGGSGAPAALAAAPASTSYTAVGRPAYDTDWTFYATFATAGACLAKAAAYKNEYWWVEATTCIHDAAHNTWLMFYES
ncbi:hypothetical protein QQY24_01980 [Streptomyces sp. TG1A-8]|uniref:hypothetical protein n=1 Tax=Streptomyces sp. TG1A-8 TaxID=3051385 RepID=UPI00265B7A70|nr:hypothetical protein [Streptomyces sp. TG1A-8]MDO0924240.1 hypothetical protein [Streptomyces sp. TG1A-8]